nr:glycosyltransferase family 9 protein [uncultured Desulfobacter sp.]
MSAIGDVIHTLPALNALRAHYPNAHITWLVEEAAADIVMGHPALDRVILSKRKQWVKQLKSQHWKAGIKGMYFFIKTLRDTRYDMVIDFQALLKSAAMVFLSRGKRKIGFDRGMQHAEGSFLFYNEKIPAIDMEIHALKRGLLFIEAMGIPAPEVVYHLPIQNKERALIRTILAQNGITGSRKLFCINPQATWETKLWDNTKFAKLADELSRTFSADIIFTGGPEDTKAIEIIRLQMTAKSVNLAGKTTLKTLAALYDYADFLITTDTGPMHLAAALGTKVVAIFGSTAPWRTGPWGDTCTVVRSGVACSPCFKRQCPKQVDYMECMNAILVSDINKAIIKRSPL